MILSRQPGRHVYFQHWMPGIAGDGKLTESKSLSLAPGRARLGGPHTHALTEGRGSMRRANLPSRSVAAARPQVTPNADRAWLASSPSGTHASRIPPSDKYHHQSLTGGLIDAIFEKMRLILWAMNRCLASSRPPVPPPQRPSDKLQLQRQQRSSLLSACFSRMTDPPQPTNSIPIAAVCPIPGRPRRPATGRGLTSPRPPACQDRTKSRVPEATQGHLVRACVRVVASPTG